jgi:hypothetical protein
MSTGLNVTVTILYPPASAVPGTGSPPLGGGVVHIFYAWGRITGSDANQVFDTDLTIFDHGTENQSAHFTRTPQNIPGFPLSWAYQVMYFNPTASALPTAQFDLVVEALDEFDEPITDRSVTITLSTGGPQVTKPAAVARKPARPSSGSTTKKPSKGAKVGKAPRATKGRKVPKGNKASKAKKKK